MGQCTCAFKHEHDFKKDEDKEKIEKMSGMIGSPLGQLVSMLKTKQMRIALAKKMNDAIDIPMIGEETEAKIFKKIIKMVVQVLEEMLEPDTDDDE